MSDPSTAGAGRRPSRRRKMVWAALAAVVLAGLVGGYVFGLYLPNKPENVWNTAFTRTGKAVSGLVDTAADKDAAKDYEKLQVSGSLDFTSGSSKFKGTVDGKFDASTADGTVAVNYTDDAGQEHKLGFDLRSQVAKGETYPDSYLRLTGLKALGVDAFLPGVGDYDGKWISISSAYLQSLAPVVPEVEAGKDPQITREDAVEVARLIEQKSNEYVFTTDPGKAVVINREFIGKEQSEDVGTYHFKAGIDKAHATAYCVAISDGLIDSAVYKKFTTAAASDPTVKQPSADEAKKDGKKSCEDSTKDIKDDNSFDLWVDKGYKLIQKVRVADPDEAGSYVEFGQTYNGGNVIPQFSRFHSDKEKSDINETFTLDTATKAMELTVTGKGEKTADADSMDLSLKLNITPLKEDVPFEKPATSVPLEDIFKRFQIDPEMFTAPISDPLLDNSSEI